MGLSPISFKNEWTDARRHENFILKIIKKSLQTVLLCDIINV